MSKWLWVPSFSFSHLYALGMECFCQGCKKADSRCLLLKQGSSAVRYSQVVGLMNTSLSSLLLVLCCHFDHCHITVSTTDLPLSWHAGFACGFACSLEHCSSAWPSLSCLWVRGGRDVLNYKQKHAAQIEDLLKISGVVAYRSWTHDDTIFSCLSVLLPSDHCSHLWISLAIAELYDPGCEPTAVCDFWKPSTWSGRPFIGALHIGWWVWFAARKRPLLHLKGFKVFYHAYFIEGQTMAYLNVSKCLLTVINYFS